MLNLFAKTETTQTLKFGTELPLWGLIAILAVGFFWIYSCYRKETACSSTVAKGLMGLFRLLVFLILMGIFIEPIWEETYNEVRKSHLIFLIDSSLSMNIQDRYPEEEFKDKLRQALSKGEPIELDETKRIEIAGKLLRNSQRLEELKEDCEIHFFKFDTVLSKLSSLPPSLEAKGQKTNIYDHVAKAIDSMQGRTIAGIFILSDGQHNTGSMSWQQAVDYAKRAEGAPPVYTVGIGSREKKKDIILTAVEAPEIALIDDQVSFEVELKNIGYQGMQVPIYLKWGETLLAEKFVTLGAEEEKQRIRINHTFRIADDYNISVLVPTQEGEFSKENNLRHHNIKIIQQKFRVLYLEGLPRWEYRYLRNALIRDETVIANTWLFSADPSFPQDKSKEAPELNGFPSKEELFKYHCVIIGDVSLNHLSIDHQRLLVEYVKEQGGGVVFIAGNRFNPQSYWDTELSPLLPIVVSRREESGGYFTQEQRLRLTPEGKRHPILKLLPDAQENIQLWENEKEGLPGFYWYFLAEKAKPGATVLAANRDNQAPIFVTQFYGKGKTFFSALDASWRWRKFYGDRYFYRFWGQVIRHVSMGILVGTGRQYYLRVDNTQYVVGEMVNVVLRVVENQQRQPVTKEEWKVFYTTPSGQTKEKILKANAGEAGTYEGSLIATEIGNYKVWLKPEDTDKEVSVLFNVDAPLAERGKTQLNEKDLIKLAVGTQGSYLKPHQLEESLNQLSPTKESIPVKIHPRPLFDKSWISWLFGAILVLFTLEWIMRKYFRLL